MNSGSTPEVRALAPEPTLTKHSSAQMLSSCAIGERVGLDLVKNVNALGTGFETFTVVPKYPIFKG